jgi:regulator of replication initiation timing
LEKDTETGRNSLTVHRLRAWNRDRVSSVIGPDYAEILLGHVDQYGNTYKNTTEKTLSEKYLQCEQALTIKDTGRIKHDIAVQADELQKIRQENDSLRGRLAAVEQREQERQEATVKINAAISPEQKKATLATMNKDELMSLLAEMAVSK